MFGLSVFHLGYNATELDLSVEIPLAQLTQQGAIRSGGAITDQRGLAGLLTQGGPLDDDAAALVPTPNLRVVAQIRHVSQSYLCFVCMVW